MQVVDDAREAGEALKTTYIFTGGYARKPPITLIVKGPVNMTGPVNAWWLGCLQLRNVCGGECRWVGG